MDKKQQLKDKIKQKVKQLKQKKDKKRSYEDKESRGVHQGAKGGSFVIEPSGKKRYLDQDERHGLQKSIKEVLYSIVVKSFIKKFKGE